MRLGDQASGIRFVQHPRKRRIGGLKSFFIWLVRAANIRMHACKPDLLEVYALPWRPDSRHKIFALFVNGKGVTGSGDVGAHLGVIKLIVALEKSHDTKRNAECADGVPYTDKMYIA